MDKATFYQHGLPQPFHVAVGAVLFNDDLEICVHHLFVSKMPERLRFLSGGLDEYYHLMRESLEGNEPLHDAVHRGLYEEFGAKGNIERYLGSVECRVTTPKHQFQKTTIYHAVRLIELGERPDIDEESRSKMEWHAPEALLEMFRRQATLTDRPELDELAVVERFIAIYGT